ncbi:MAG: hypothetical protein GF390_01270 [Candidatus Pacebacteria bacterium]|nr:hypothetical protein [Candidatus Paceibacterota bacterium]
MAKNKKSGSKKTKKNKSAKNKGKKQAQQNPLISDNSQVTITIPGKKAQQAYEQALKKLATKVKSQGFRPGKVPPEIAEKILGKAKVIEHALEQLLPPAYQAAIKKAKKQPLTYPKLVPIKLELGKDWQIKAEFAEKPQVKLGKYQQVVKQAKKKGQQALKKLLKEQQQAHKKTSKNKSKADKKSPPAKPSPQQQKDFTLQQIFAALIKTIKPAIAQLLVEQETKQELRKLKTNLKQLNLSLEDYLKKRQLQPTALTNELAASALSRLQLEFILAEIAVEQKITVTKKELQDKIKALTPDKPLKWENLSPEQQHYFQDSVLKEKIIDYLWKL